MRALKHFLMVFAIVAVLSASAQALIVNDPINSAYNLLRNTLMQLQHVENLKSSLDRLLELRRTFEEIKRVNTGIDEIRSLFLGDFKNLLYRYSPINLSSLGYRLSQAQQDFYALINGSSLGGAEDYKSHLDSIFGQDPQSQTKPYITQEELLAADSYRWASEVKKVIDKTIDAGEDISRASQTSSPKGAARLTADALGKIVVTQAQIQQNQSKLIEIGATQIEQVSREEKNYERERIKFMREFNRLLDALPAR